MLLANPSKDQLNILEIHCTSNKIKSNIWKEQLKHLCKFIQIPWKHKILLELYSNASNLSSSNTSLVTIYENFHEISLQIFWKSSINKIGGGGVGWEGSEVGGVGVGGVTWAGAYGYGEWLGWGEMSILTPQLIEHNTLLELRYTTRKSIKNTVKLNKHSFH